MIKKYNKLMGDNLIEIIENKGCKVEYEVLDEKKYENEFNKKFQEEVKEYLIDNNIEEIADIMEVINAMLKHKSIIF